MRVFACVCVWGGVMSVYSDTNIHTRACTHAHSCGLSEYIIQLLSVHFSSSNIGEFSKDVKLLAALEEEETDGDKLLEAARRLAGAFTDLLRAAQPGSQEVINWLRTKHCPISSILHRSHSTRDLAFRSWFAMAAVLFRAVFFKTSC